MTTQLCRSRTDSMIAGVCGGLAKTLAVDPVIIRLFFVVFTLAGGAGVLIYLILWFIMPLEGEGSFGSKETAQAGFNEMADHARSMVGRATTTTNNTSRVIWVGIILVAIGTTALLRNLGMPWMNWLHMGTIWPILLIIVGIAQIVRRSTEV
jgi:phage shock protein C